MSPRIQLLDSTLADGIRADDVALTPVDQMRIALRLDALGAASPDHVLSGVTLAIAVNAALCVITAPAVARGVPKTR